MNVATGQRPVTQAAPIRSNHEDRGQGRSTPSVETLLRETHAMLGNTSVRMSPSKRVRLCRDYVNLVAPKGVPFGRYLANAVVLNAEDARQFDALYYRLSYADITGETAVRNVLGGGGRVA